MELQPVHLISDSERFLRAHGEWRASWDQSDCPDQPDIEVLTRAAHGFYSAGLTPVEVGWKLRDRHPSIPDRTLRRAQRAAEKALLAAETAPSELRRALVAAARNSAIQGALATGDWGQALKGLERAGLIAGELREGAGLCPEDLVLTVQVEAPALPEEQEGSTAAPPEEQEASEA